MLDFSKNYELTRKAAAEGMVLLKNEQSLPILKNERVGIIGDSTLILGGGGSAAVKTVHIKTLEDGLVEKNQEGKLHFYNNSDDIVKNKLSYSVEDLNRLAKNIDKAIVVIKRNACEGTDRLIDKDRKSAADKAIPSGEIYDSIDDILNDFDKRGYYYPHQYELQLLENIEKSNIKDVVVILNIASVVDLTFLEKYSKVKSILLSYLPGMEAGRAIADILCGDVNPSGKLTDTFALDYNDYPSSPYYNISKDISEYKEGIFVGYRYFETYAKDKVLYPFGFGLSYTDFDFSVLETQKTDDSFDIKVCVKNIGNIAGKEVIQVYYNAPDGKLKKPYLQLCEYAKTKLLQPNEIDILEISFKLKDMASFDDEFENRGSYVLEKGTYNFFVGNSVRNIKPCGNLDIDELIVTEKLSLQFSNYEMPNKVIDKNHPDAEIDKGITLYDVAGAKNSIEEFVRQMTPEELIHLAQGQHCDFPKGTGGIGNLEKYGIPNPQTADGPAGIRKAVPTTYFPCATLIASSFDKDLTFKIGEAMGFEGISTGVDILLAPGLNIHRNPLCGRNFEYYSEDPYITGKTAAAMVKGIQSKGLCATIKHFFANNCETNRKCNNSVISERTAREIYLKGFEIAVKEGNPAFVMSSYNLVNGNQSSSNRIVLTNILRGEWGFKSAVMTDWRTDSHLWEEIKAGNNIKMPFGYPDEAQLALKKYNEGVLTRTELEINAIAVLNSVMKTNRFKTKNFGIVHKILPNCKNKIDVVKTLGISSTRASIGDFEGRKYLCSLASDQRHYPTYIYYSIDVSKTGKYRLSTDIKTDCPETRLWISIDNKLLSKIPCDIAVDKNIWYTVSDEITLYKGKHNLKIMVVNDPNEKFECSNDLYSPTVDLALYNIVIKEA